MLTKYNFTRFTGVYPRGDTKISIQKSGLIRLSAGFCRATGISGSSYKYTVLYYDDSNEAIAFKFTNVAEDGVLRITKDRLAASISAKAFMRANNINLRDSRRYDWKKLTLPNIGEVYIIEIGKK